MQNWLMELDFPANIPIDLYKTELRIFQKTLIHFLRSIYYEAIGSEHHSTNVADRTRHIYKAPQAGTIPDTEVFILQINYYSQCNERRESTS